MKLTTTEHYMELNQSEWVTQSYAKINLGLQVLRKLPTGYHEIKTGFCFIEWSDRFSVKKANQLLLNMSDESIPTDDRNLIIKAIKHLQNYVHFQGHHLIKVDKKIPAGAGLGGGSSNAATIIRMINKIEQLGLSDADLADLCAGIGADVPLFLKGKPGIASGIGTTIKHLDIQPDCWILTVFPDILSSTAEAYGYCVPDENPQFDLEDILVNEDLEEWKYLLQNDLETSVVQRHPLVGDLRDQLYEFGATYAAMSGSGSAVFGLFEQEFLAAESYNTLLDLGFKVNLTPPNFKPDFMVYEKG
ncbi:MAG: 4-(cytidine 5'-diphospho)-2-C-methyl-D-erythritol kinase [Balneolales bacterium]